MRHDQLVAETDLPSTLQPHAPDTHRQMKLFSGPIGSPSGGQGPRCSARIAQTTPSSSGQAPDGSASLVRAPGPTPVHIPLACLFGPQCGVHAGTSVGGLSSKPKFVPRGQRGPSEHVVLGVGYLVPHAMRTAQATRANFRLNAKPNRATERMLEGYRVGLS